MGSVASLIFYISAFILSVLFVHWGNRKRARKLTIILGERRLVINPFLILGVAIPILIAGFRQGVGTDFNNYIIEYNAATQSGSYLEISFNIIASISNILFGSPTFMFIVFSALTVVPVMLAINKSTILLREYRWLFWMLFLFIMFPQTFNLLRQGVAVAIGFYLLVSVIEERKLFRLSHFLWLLLAISFHVSAWILVPLCYVASLLNNTRIKSLIFFLIISSILVLIGFSLLPQLLALLGSGWTGYIESTEGISRSVVPRSLLIIFILLVCWKFYATLKIVNSYTALLWLGLLFSIGGLSIAYFERIGYYTTLLVPLLVLVVTAQAVPKSQARVIDSFIFLLGLVYFVVVYYLIGSSDVFPYNWSIQ